MTSQRVLFGSTTDHKIGLADMFLMSESILYFRNKSETPEFNPGNAPEPNVAEVPRDAEWVNVATSLSDKDHQRKTGPRSVTPEARPKQPLTERSKASSSASASIRKVAIASFVGTTTEWYDFFLYGIASALIFNKLFFGAGLYLVAMFLITRPQTSEQDVIIREQAAEQAISA